MPLQHTISRISSSLIPFIDQVCISLLKRDTIGYYNNALVINLLYC